MNARKLEQELKKKKPFETLEQEGTLSVIRTSDQLQIRFSRLFREHGETNTIHFMIARELYSHLERVVDRFEDVANEIDGLVIDHA